LQAHPTSETYPTSVVHEPTSHGQQFSFHKTTTNPKNVLNHTCGTPTKTNMVHQKVTPLKENIITESSSKPPFGGSTWEINQFEDVFPIRTWEFTIAMLVFFGVVTSVFLF